MHKSLCKQWQTETQDFSILTSHQNDVFGALKNLDRARAAKECHGLILFSKPSSAQGRRTVTKVDKHTFVVSSDDILAHCLLFQTSSRKFPLLLRLCLSATRNIPKTDSTVIAARDNGVSILRGAYVVRDASWVQRCTKVCTRGFTSSGCLISILGIRSLT